MSVHNESPRPSGFRVCLWTAVFLAGGVAQRNSFATSSTASSTAQLSRFAGTWERAPGQSVNFDPAVKSGHPDAVPLTPDYAKQYKVATDAAEAGKPIHDLRQECYPQGFPRVMTMAMPFEILATDKKLVLIPEEQSPIRTIWVDGRSHPTDLDPTYMGNSVAHWDGAVLVVDTIGLRAETYVDFTNVPHSSELHGIERLSLEDSDNTLKDQITLIDPKALAKPWTVTRIYKRAHYDIQESVCEENNRNTGTTDSVQTNQGSGK